MISHPRRCSIVSVLALTAATLATPALADDIDLPPDVPGPITGVAWMPGSDEVVTVDEEGSLLSVRVPSGRSTPVAFTGRPESVQALSLFDELLYIGDVGDADSSRDFVTVFRIDPASEATTYWAWDFRYPGGPRDARAVAVSGKGRIYIITDGEDPGIYRAGSEPSRSGVNNLVRAADAPAGVTDAVFLDDGTTLMMRTGSGVELVDGYSWESRALTTYEDPPSGEESITIFGEDRMLVGDGRSLRDEPVPDGRTTVTPGSPPEKTPSVSPTPSESPTPRPQPSTDIVASNTETVTVSRRGTALALLGAGVVAVLAGVVVLVVRD